MSYESSLDERVGYQFSVLKAYYAKIKANESGFSNSSIINFLNDLPTSDLLALHTHIHNIEYDLYYDWECGVKQDYNALEEEYQFYIKTIESIVVQKEGKNIFNDEMSDDELIKRLNIDENTFTKIKNAFIDMNNQLKNKDNFDRNKNK